MTAETCHSCANKDAARSAALTYNIWCKAINARTAPVLMRECPMAKPDESETNGRLECQ